MVDTRAVWWRWNRVESGIAIALKKEDGLNKNQRKCPKVVHNIETPKQKV